MRRGRTLPVPISPSLAALPGQIDAFLKDHFGLRHAMIQLHHDLTKPMLGFRRRNCRRPRRPPVLSRRRYGAAERRASSCATSGSPTSVDLIASMRDELQKRGIRFLVASPPNTSTIYKDDLPVWAQKKGPQAPNTTCSIDDLAARGIQDGRSAGRRSPPREQRRGLPDNDAHWTARGAIAAFNAVVEADGHPDWRIDPATALGPPELRKGGDIARIAWLEDEVSEADRSLWFCPRVVRIARSPTGDAGPRPDDRQAPGRRFW